MKNPFVQMAVFAAAMAAAFHENAWRDAGGYKPSNGHPGSKRRHPHFHNPTGSKFLRRAYKAKTGRRGTYGEAVEWYAGMTEKYPNMPFPFGDRRNPRTLRIGPA